MRMLLRVLGVGLIAGGLALSGCKKGEETETPPEATEPAEAAETQPAAVEEPAAAEEDEPAEVEPVDEGNFINAYYEITCVRAKVTDPAKAAEMIGEIYPKYGFTEESFKGAESKLAEKESVKLALTERMKACTEDAAMGFASAEEPGDADADTNPEEGEETEKKKVKKKNEPAFTGRATARGISAADLVQTELVLSVLPNYSLNGFFKGVREGKRFSIPLQGTVSKTGRVSASGKQGQNSAKVTGEVNKNGVVGSVSGTINAKPYSGNFQAK